MSEPKIVIIHSYDCSPIVEIAPDRNVPPKTAYIMNQNQDMMKFSNELNDLKKQVRTFRRRYSNLLKRNK